LSVDFEIREIDPERDAPGIVEVMHESFPSTATPESWRQQYATIPPRARHAGWVAIVDGQVAGRAEASLNAWSDTGTGIAGVSVATRFRRRGIGSALWGHAEEHLRQLAPIRVLSWFIERDEAVAFARARGFAETRADALSGIDPQTLDYSRLDSATVELVPLRELRAEDVYEVDMITTADVPMTDRVEHMPFEEWQDMIWNRPAITLDGSFGALAEARLASITVLAANLEKRRAFNEYTGTLPQHRGRGLATLVKLASLRWARDQRITEVWTTNDETNAPMLEVNRRLGYETRVRRVEYMRAS
jgi:GNAT superfamily N-acetyltransferase